MNVYWSPWVIDQTGYIEYPEITRLSATMSKNMKGNTDKSQAYQLCPAVIDYAQNVFELKSPIDFDIVRDDNGGFYTNYYDQQFWNDFVQFRNSNLISFNIYYVVIPDFDVDIEISSAHFTDNEFTRKTMIVPGKFNAYKWVRPIQCSFAIRDDVDSIKISRGDTLSYLRICTDKVIKPKKFMVSANIRSIVDRSLSLKFRNSKIKPLTYWYDLYESSRIRKKIMTEINSNLLED